MSINSKEKFLNEITSLKTKELLQKLKRQALAQEYLQNRAISLIRDSKRQCRDYYPYVHLPSQIREKIVLLNQLFYYFENLTSK